ncbi:hypothetical protein GTW51_14810 [Aurantimonas aggregata]|uniref:Uncharacterized protein n=1 Tax=Aurantimonas aggregata TaxID=2047720 RepID=A0A6L9MJB9_9HYPH|nr:hypothetical protein [Aurantimonas aggregata]NDV87974.1 hypothetical protein [Aurantimonas aggregata]
MGHNLEVAVDIADIISDASENLLPLDVASTTSQLLERHHVLGLSSEDVAAALREESNSAGVTTLQADS